MSSFDHKYDNRYTAMKKNQNVINIFMPYQLRYPYIYLRNEKFNFKTTRDNEKYLWNTFLSFFQVTNFNFF